MIFNPVLGICHPRVGINICLLAGSKKGIHHGNPLWPQWEPTNKKFFLPIASVYNLVKLILRQFRGNFLTLSVVPQSG
jgi:hypothetical protein